MGKILTIKENILQFIDKQHIVKEEFYRKTSISASNFKGNGLKSEIGGEKIVKILTCYPEINPEWLLTGKGSMLKSEEKEDKIIAERIDTFSLNLTNENLIPIVSTETAAGFGSDSFSINQADITDYCNSPSFAGNVDFMVPVRGDSMYPWYRSGDLVACKKITDNTFMQWNKIHVIATREQGLLLKRIKKSETPGYITAISDNKEYDPIDIPESEITGIALVLGGIKFE